MKSAPPNPPDGQVVVAGAGIAGLALAIMLGRRGIAVTLLDKVPPPRDRVCGEGIMPMGVEVLRELGVDPAGLPGADFAGLEFSTRRQAHRIDFDPQRRGRGVRRTTLIAALEAEAARHETIRPVLDEVLEPIRDQHRIVGLRGEGGEYRAPVVVAADGARSPLLRGTDVPIRQRGYRMALRLHFRTARPLEMACVRIGLFPPYDVYLTPVGEREFVATTMTDRPGYRAIVNGYAAFLRDSPFGALFAGAEPASEQLEWYHPLFRPTRYVAEGMPVVGDAGGGIDPCLGLGMSLALVSSRLAARAIEAILTSPGDRPAAEAAFHHGRAKLFAHYAVFDRIFRWLVTTRPGSETMLWGMRHWPATTGTVTAIITENRPWRTFRWRELLHPV